MTNANVGRVVGLHDDGSVAINVRADGFFEITFDELPPSGQRLELAFDECVVAGRFAATAVFKSDKHEVRFPVGIADVSGRNGHLQVFAKQAVSNTLVLFPANDGSELELVQ